MVQALKEVPEIVIATPVLSSFFLLSDEVILLVGSFN
jgi:hypothetical protein